MQKKLLMSLLFALLQCACMKEDDSRKIMNVEVTGHEFNWYFRYPGEDGVLGNKDDRYTVQDLFLPEQTRVKLRLSSKDYIYSFALPELNKREVAVPDLEFHIEFDTGEARSLKLLGDQFCGYSHQSLIGELFIGKQNLELY